MVLDNDDCLWVGTAGGGLNKYCPISGTFTRHNFKFGSNKYYGNIINDLAFDNDGNLWIGTFNDGLIRFNPKTWKSIRFTYQEENPESISGNNVNTILVDSKNRIWIGLEDNNLNLFLPESQTFKKFPYKSDVKPDKLGNSISDLIDDIEGNIWIGTHFGGFIFKFEPESEVFTNYVNGFPGSTHCFAFSGPDSLWMGSNYSGLFMYELSKNVTQIYSSGSKQGLINYNTIRSLYNDRDGSLWIGTDGKGINIYSSNKKKFQTYMHKSPKIHGLSLCSVRAIYVDDNDFLWVGGYRISDEFEGFSRIDMNTNEIVNVDPDGVVYCIMPDQTNKDILWLGTEGQGIIEFNTSNLDSKRYNQSPPFCSDSISGVNVYCMVHDDDGTIYTGTETGLNVDNQINKTCNFYKHDPSDSSSINMGFIKTLYIDREKNIWVGSSRGGFSRFDYEKGIFVRYIHSPDDAGSLSDNNVNSFYEDSKGRFWIGTGRGLNLMNRTTGKFSKVTVAEGLPNNVVYASLEDENGNLWLSTNEGLCRYNPDTKEVVIYDKNDGLPSNEFNRSAYLKSNDGRMFFGGTDGLVSFYPSEIVRNQALAQPIITRYFVNNIETYTDSNISLKQKLIIKPDEHIVGFEVSAMSFLNSEKCQYRYKLENFMENWIELGDRRRISFTNLDPGIYTLMILASNSDGIWSLTPRKLTIEVEPHFYETFLFKLLGTLLILGLILLIYFGRIRIIRKQESKLKLLVEQRTSELSETNEKLSVASKTKDKLYSIIAHDLRSPFNSLIGFSDLLVDNWNTMNDEERIEIIKIVKSTSHSTFDLLVNLLEWSQIQSGEIKYEPRYCNFDEVLNEAIKPLKAQATYKSITIENNVESKLEVFADVQMINSVIRNLISNAIKFTSKNGAIKISTSSQDEFISCYIQDDGVGISENDMRFLFDADKNTSSKGTEGEKGAGFGLILCKELLTKNNGTISVESEVGVGSSITITLPKAKLDNE